VEYHATVSDGNPDLSLFEALNGAWTCGLLDATLPWLDRGAVAVGAMAAVLIATGVVASWRGDPRRAWIAVAAAALAVAVIDPLGHHLIKPLIGRARPCQEMTVRLLVDCGSGYALPSLHAANSFGAVTALVTVLGWRAAPLYAAALLSGYSRVYVGVHWPGDVLAGALYGAVIGLALGWIGRRVVARITRET